MTIETFVPGKDATPESTISWNFPGDTRDYPFSGWNFSTTTVRDYACECGETGGRRSYMSDLAVHGGCICVLWVTGMPGILEWENDNVGDRPGPAPVMQPERSPEYQ